MHCELLLKKIKIKPAKYTKPGIVYHFGMPMIDSEMETVKTADLSIRVQLYVFYNSSFNIYTGWLKKSTPL